MSYFHPDMVLFIATIFVLIVFVRLYKKFDGNINGLKVTLFGIGLFLIASFFNYFEETPFGYLMLTVTDEAGWDFIIPIFGYAPGGLLICYGFFDWLKMTLVLKEEMVQRELIEQELKQALIDVGRANSAKNQFMSTMSHELRTPLNAIIGFADIMADPKFIALTAAKYVEYSGIISKSAAQLLNTIDEILNLADADAHEYSLTEEIFCLEDVVNECLYIMSLQAEKANVHLNKKIETVNHIYADRRLVKQMASNLISDAIKHSPPKGHVTCSIDINNDNRAVSITVSDEGAPIKIDRIHRTNDSFEYVPGVVPAGQRGASLALALVQRFIKLHDGYIEIPTTHNDKTIVKASFPVVRRRNI